ncbi:MAG: flavodoxin domain-containing protein [Chloroflexia bacterium]
MGSRVLVAYATRYGATAEIAEQIGRVLREAGLQVDVLPMAQVDNVEPYDAVVLGSAVYIGKWLREASAFLKAKADLLAERPVWLFSSGPTGEGDPVALLKGWRFPEGLRELVERTRPRDVAVFHGRLDPERLRFGARWIIRRIQAPTGDFRDWGAIERWARGIAAALST